MQGITLTYEAAVTGVGNYLSAQVEGKINPYQMKMLENNEIPGLLPARGSMLNGVYRVSYEIDGMRRLGAVLAGGQLCGEAAKRFMGGLLRALSGLGEYFLSYMQCLLETDYIYVDRRGNARLVYLPLSGRTVADEEAVRAFCQKLFAEYFTADGDPFFLKLLRYVNMQDFSFAGLLEWFAPEDEAADAGAAAIQPQRGYGSGESASESGTSGLRVPSDAALQGNVASQGDVPPRRGIFGAGIQKGAGEQKIPAQDTVGAAQEASAPQKASNSDFAIPNQENQGFAIPGGHGFAVPQGRGEKKKDEAKEKEKKEKGGSLFKALLGSKKDKQEEKPKGDEGRRNGAGNAVFGGRSAGGASSVGNANDRTAGGFSSGMGNAGRGAADEWHGTVVLDGSAGENTVTTMLGGSSTPYLLYQGNRILLEHFPFSIGKENVNFILEKNVVSRTHASINSRNGGYYVTDENSKNHTYLNGRQLAPYTEAELHDGDTLRLASESMTFHV